MNEKNVAPNSVKGKRKKKEIIRLKD